MRPATACAPFVHWRRAAGTRRARLRRVARRSVASSRRTAKSRWTTDAAEVSRAAAHEVRAVRGEKRCRCDGAEGEAGPEPKQLVARGAKARRANGRLPARVRWRLRFAGARVAFARRNLCTGDADSFAIGGASAALSASLQATRGCGGCRRRRAPPFELAAVSTGRPRRNALSAIGLGASVDAGGGRRGDGGGAGGGERRSRRRSWMTAAPAVGGQTRRSSFVEVRASAPARSSCSARTRRRPRAIAASGRGAAGAVAGGGSAETGLASGLGSSSA